MAFTLHKAAFGRTPDMVDRYDMPAAEVASGKAVKYDTAGDDLTVMVTAASGGAVLGICMSEPNQTIEEGGGITFPLGGTDIQPVVLRVSKETMLEAPVSATITLANGQPTDTLDISADGLSLIASTNGDFIIERVLTDDGTNVTRVAGYFVNPQIGA